MVGSNICKELFLSELGFLEAVGHVIDHPKDGIRQMDLLCERGFRSGSHANDVAKRCDEAHLRPCLEPRTDGLDVGDGPLVHMLDICFFDGGDKLGAEVGVDTGDDVCASVVVE